MAAQENYSGFGKMLPIVTESSYATQLDECRKITSENPDDPHVSKFCHDFIMSCALTLF